MKKIFKKIFNNLAFIVVLLALIVVLVGSILVTYRIIDLLLYSYLLIGIGVASIIVYVINKIKKTEFTIFEYGIFVLIVLALLSLLGTINYETALWGLQSRREGLFVILTYYILALVASTIDNKKEKKTIVAFFIVIGLMNIIYGLLQMRWIKIYNLTIVNRWFYAKGFCGNSMNYGSLISMIYPIIIGLFIKETAVKKNFLYAILLIIYTLGALVSGSLALIVSSIIVFIFIFIKSIIQLKKSKLKEYRIEIYKLMYCVVVFIIMTIIVGYKGGKLFEDLNIMKNEATQIVKEAKIEDGFGTGRINIWKNTISKIKEHPLFGIGIDNFPHAFSEPVLDNNINGKTYVVQKAHNEYLQITLCEGIIAGITYTVFLIALGVKNINNNEKICYALLLGFVCYSIQAFFGISVTRVSPFFFIILGLLMGKNKKVKS